MTTIKKLLTATATITLAFSLSACGDDDTVKEEKPKQEQKAEKKEEPKMSEADRKKLVNRIVLKARQHSDTTKGQLAYIGERKDNPDIIFDAVGKLVEEDAMLGQVSLESATEVVVQYSKYKAEDLNNLSNTHLANFLYNGQVLVMMGKQHAQTSGDSRLQDIGEKAVQLSGMILLEDEGVGVVKYDLEKLNEAINAY